MKQKEDEIRKLNDEIIKQNVAIEGLNNTINSMKQALLDNEEVKYFLNFSNLDYWNVKKWKPNINREKRIKVELHI